MLRGPALFGPTMPLLSMPIAIDCVSPADCVEPEHATQVGELLVNRAAETRLEGRLHSPCEAELRQALGELLIERSVAGARDRPWGEHDRRE
jgi:hypothetical protein